MTAVIRPLTASPAWKSIEAHHQKIRELHLRELFSDDPKRGERMTVEQPFERSLSTSLRRHAPLKSKS
jgi:hypothetical protein